MEGVQMFAEHLCDGSYIGIPITVDKYILCLDTNKHAGDFERCATAYATGIVDECDSGETEAKLFNAVGVPQDIIDELEDKILSLPDEHGYFLPCEIQATPGWVNDGMGTQYKQSMDAELTPEQIEIWRNLHRKYVQESLNRAILNKWTQGTIADYTKSFEGVETNLPHWCPAYNTVGIFLEEPLSDAALKIVLSRVKEYLAQKNITLEGVRLITEFSNTKSERIEWESVVS